MKQVSLAFLGNLVKPKPKVLWKWPYYLEWLFPFKEFPVIKKLSNDIFIRMWRCHNNYEAYYLEYTFSSVSKKLAFNQECLSIYRNKQEMTVKQETSSKQCGFTNSQIHKLNVDKKHSNCFSEQKDLGTMYNKKGNIWYMYDHQVSNTLINVQHIILVGNYK